MHGSPIRRGGARAATVRYESTAGHRPVGELASGVGTDGVSSVCKSVGDVGEEGEGADVEDDPAVVSNRRLSAGELPTHGLGAAGFSEICCRLGANLVHHCLVQDFIVAAGLQRQRLV